jgi:hypothetical protein
MGTQEASTMAMVARTVNAAVVNCIFAVCRLET